MTPLFRQQVVDKYRANRLEGEIEISIGIGWRVITLFFLCLVAGLFVFTLLADFSKKESAIGILNPQSGLAKVFALKPGEVKQLFVKEGDNVIAGQKLAVIEIDPVVDGGAVMADAELATSQQRIAETKNQITLQDQHFRIQGNALEAKIANLKVQIDGLQKSRDLQMGSISLVENDVAAARKLASKGFLPKLELNKRENELQSEKIELQSLELNLAFSIDLSQSY